MVGVRISRHTKHPLSWARHITTHEAPKEEFQPTLRLSLPSPVCRSVHFGRTLSHVARPADTKIVFVRNHRTQQIYPSHPQDLHITLDPPAALALVTALERHVRPWERGYKHNWDWALYRDQTLLRLGSNSGFGFAGQ